jgi:hypothetical protein
MDGLRRKRTLQGKTKFIIYTPIARRVRVVHERLGHQYNLHFAFSSIQEHSEAKLS